jgi:aryl-alcohol dehydrogenase-like predicted oxidoreductase
LLAFLATNQAEKEFTYNIGFFRRVETMEKRLFGKTGLEVSPLGFGGAEIGFEKAEEKTVQKLLYDALEGGLNVIDTAECYEGSEELIGKALVGKRSQYYLFSKCGHGATPFIDAWKPEELEQSIERSLRLLKTDYLDLIQLHSCSQAVLQNGDVIDVLARAKKAGKTRFIGYSGDGQDALYAIKSGAFDTLQTSISIADQEAIDLTLPLAAQQQIGVIAKRPIANAVWRNRSKPANDYVLPYWERLNKLGYDFINGKNEGVTEIALRFTLSLPGVHVAIVGTSKPERWRENAAYVRKGPLSKNALEAIRDKWKTVANAQWVGQV